MSVLFFSIIFVYLTLFVKCEEIPIPKNFFLGAATAAYQIEGGWNEDGKGESIWDKFVHEKSHWIKDGSSGDVAADSYHKLEEDIKLLKKMKMNMYRFSISWSRILPKGDLSEINEKGIQYYNRLIDRLIEEGIEPMATMYHWDLPQRLQTDFGGWTNPIMANFFEDYAWLLFSLYGDRVKWWITVNEPMISCFGYILNEDYPSAPGVNASGVGDYLCAHSQLLSHTKAYNLYQNKFKHLQKGKIGVSFNIFWYQPKTSDPEDIKATQDRLTWELHWLAHPIFSKEGDYPKIMRERILENSLKEGLRKSRLPQFTNEEILMVRGSADFLGINTYSSYLISRGLNDQNPSWLRDSRAIAESDPKWDRTQAPWVYNTPWGMLKLLRYIHEEYPNTDLFITENGYPDAGELEDTKRSKYLIDNLRYSLQAVSDYNVPLIGYLYWSLLDNMEWAHGYRIKFGLCYVNFSDPERKRIMKHSAYVYADIAKKWSVPFSIDHIDF